MASQRQDDNKVEDDVPQWTFAVCRGDRETIIGSVTVTAPTKPKAILKAVGIAREKYPATNGEFLDADSETFALRN